MKKTKEEVMREYEEAYIDLNKSKTYSPMTLEGCVVRISDIIGYIGRDIEDAIRLGKINREELPSEITDVIGSTNKEIVNTIIMDIIENSMDKPYIKMSEKVYIAIQSLKNFNYKNIYNNAYTKEERQYYKDGINNIFYQYYNDIKNNNTNSKIYTVFLNKQSKEYLDNTKDARKVIDYIAGMTDDFLLREIETCKNS